MSELDSRVLGSVSLEHGRTIKEIAKHLRVSSDLVRESLARLKGQVIQDFNYRWFLKKQSEVIQKEQPAAIDTPLSSLSKYYLDCLNHEDLGGVSEFAASKYGDPAFLEVHALPMVGASAIDPSFAEQARQFASPSRADRKNQTLYIGYPVLLKFVRSRKGWEGFMVEPIFLFPYELATPSTESIDDPPQLNFKALRTLVDSDEANMLEEAIQLAEELGLDANSTQPDLQDLVARLREIRSEWNWQEDVNPLLLSKGPPLSDLNRAGIYNRAIVGTSARSPYTKGLESELKALQLLPELGYRDTALGRWLAHQRVVSQVEEQQPLLEILPLNTEQRQAVRQGLSNQLTVITGPPGTGKSQVVTSLLINAAWQGKTALLASKNNKAVDVVETRANALGPRPVLLRLGAGQFQNRLAEYLTSLLGASATPEDSAAYDECLTAHSEIATRSTALDVETQALIDARNTVDDLEKKLEAIRTEAGDELFRVLGRSDAIAIRKKVAELLRSIEGATRARQSLATRIMWPVLRKRRYLRLQSAAVASGPVLKSIGLRPPVGTPDSVNTDEWILFGEKLDRRIAQAAGVHAYFKALKALTNTKSLEDISAERASLIDRLVANSQRLWHSWLRLQPARLDSKQRKLLGDYGALLQLIVSANEKGGKLGKDVLQRYNRLFPEIASILSCWAVTSLSAKGRVPFEPNFFDLLIIDEASQCDIASALPLLLRARQVVIIGDPKQLRHISTLSRLKDQQLLGKYGLVEEYAGWSYSAKSLFDLAASNCASEDVVVLRDHHRSHADIIGFSNEVFYEGNLRVATKHDVLRRPATAAAVRWVDVRGRVSRPPAGGAVNEKEARAVLGEIERLVRQGYSGTVGVVSPFRAQANLIRDLVNAHGEISPHASQMDLLIDTVHKFQGDERDVMIFSPVVSEGITIGALSFLRNTPNLFNVAITRARAALVVVGDQGAAAGSTIDYLARFAAYSDTIALKAREPSRETMADLGDTYPAVASPELVSDWERVLYVALRRQGLRPIPQYSVEKYLLDFALRSGGRSLDIEVDGERYHRRWDGELCRRDQIRNQRMIELGWEVMRFWVYQIRDDLNGCIKRVQDWSALTALDDKSVQGQP